MSPHPRHARTRSPQRRPARRGAALLAALLLSSAGLTATAPPAATAAATSAVPGRANPVAGAPTAATRVDRMSATFTAPTGARSTYHLFTSGVRGPLRGVVVYLDGDGMYGHDHPTSTWALGGSRGVVAQAAARGMATLSVRTPDRAGVATFWENGSANAAYVAALTRAISRNLGTNTAWFVGYSGGSQLLTQYLLPAYPALVAGGGAVITGGGGAPRRATPALARAARPGAPLLWYTGSADDGSTADDGYDALDDAREGAAWYRARGFAATRQEPRGLDHSDLGTRFGTVLAGALDRAAHTGWQARVTPARSGVAVSVSFPRGTSGNVQLVVRRAGVALRAVTVRTATRSASLVIPSGLAGRYDYVVAHNGVVRASGAFATR